MIFGSRRDAEMYQHIGREFLYDVVEQEVLYYKHDLQSEEGNIYGESNAKVYWTPVHICCLIKRGDQEWNSQDYGPDLTRNTSFAFYKQDLRDRDVLPEVGDIIEWSKDYWEIDGVKENQMWLGKDQDYRLDENTWRFGNSVSCVCSTHLSRITKLNVIERYESRAVIPEPRP